MSAVLNDVCFIVVISPLLHVCCLIGSLQEFDVFIVARCSIVPLYCTWVTVMSLSLFVTY